MELSDSHKQLLSASFNERVHTCAAGSASTAIALVCPSARRAALVRTASPRSPCYSRRPMTVECPLRRGRVRDGSVRRLLSEVSLLVITLLFALGSVPTFSATAGGAEVEAKGETGEEGETPERTTLQAHTSRRASDAAGPSSRRTEANWGARALQLRRFRLPPRSRSCAPARRTPPSSDDDDEHDYDARC